jgi:hypothetical protein
LQRPPAALERERLRVVIATIVVNVVAVSLLAFAPWSDWSTGAALNILDNCLLVGFVFVRREALPAQVVNNPDGVGAAFPPWILAGEQSGSLTRIAAGNVSLRERMKS